MPIQMTNLQAQAYLSDVGYKLLTSAIIAHGSPYVGNQVNLSTFNEFNDSAVAAGAIAYFEEQTTLTLNAILSTEGYNAYTLLLRNNQVEADAIKAMLTQHLIAKPTSVRQVVSFGLYGAMLTHAEEESDDDCILTPAAMMLIKERTSSDALNTFELFETYVDGESELSYCPVMEYVLRTLRVADLKFSAVYHKRALPIFVQMMRSVPEIEIDELRKRFDNWIMSNITDYEKFGVVVVGALQIFYRQMLAKSDWPK
jgi:hypothetical protein